MPSQNIVTFTRKAANFILATALSTTVTTQLQATATDAVSRDSIKTAGDEFKVYGYSWTDKQITPSAVVVAIHGGVQHAGVYSAIAEQLAPKGFVIYSVDLRGHGQWLVDSKKLPKLNYNASTQDVVKLTHQLRAQYPGLPIYCMGESLGAATALHAVALEPKLFDGLILASPGTSPNMSHAWKPVIGSVEQGFSTLGTSISLSSHLKRISDDSRSCDEMINDPRNRNKASLGDLIHAAHFVRQNRSLAAKVDKTVPVLLLEGGNDQICSDKSIDSLFTLFQGPDKVKKTFPGTGHLLLTTKFLKPEVVTTVEDWLAMHNSTAGQTPLAKIEPPREDQIGTPPATQ